MKPSLCLTTPVIRPENIPVIAAHPEMAAASEFLDIRWEIIIDCDTLGQDVHPHPIPSFARVTNLWLPRTGTRNGEDLYVFLFEAVAGAPAPLKEDEFHLGLSDDNLPAVGMFAALAREIREGADAVVFPMRGDSWDLKAAPENIHPSAVDGGQAAIRRRIMGDIRFSQWQGNPCIDGHFLNAVHEATKRTANWRFLDAPTMTHNALRRG